MANGLFSSLFGTGRQTPGLPMDKGTAALTPDQASLQQLRQLMTGDVSKSLTGGERLMALGALLRSAARGSQVTPQEVMGQVRQTAQTRAATQLQLAQLEAKAQRDQQQQAFIQRYAESLPENQRDILKNMDTGEAFKTVSETAFRPKQVFQLIDGPAGTKIVQYGDGSRAETDLPNSVETTTLDVGDKKLLIDKRTGATILDFKVGIAPADAARLSQGERRLQLETRRVNQEGSGGGREAKDIWVSGPDGKPMKVRGVSVGGNRYNVGGRVMEAVPSPSGGAGLWGDLSGVLDGTGKARFGGR